MSAADIPTVVEQMPSGGGGSGAFAGGTTYLTKAPDGTWQIVPTQWCSWKPGDPPCVFTYTPAAIKR